MNRSRSAPIRRCITACFGGGALVGQSPITLRLLSWLAYGAGGIVMVAQSRAFAADQRRGRALCGADGVLQLFSHPFFH